MARIFMARIFMARIFMARILMVRISAGAFLNGLDGPSPGSEIA